MAKCYVTVKCDQCLKAGYIVFHYSGGGMRTYTGGRSGDMPTVADVGLSRSAGKWSSVDCNYCKKKDTLQIYSIPGKETVTKQEPKTKGVMFSPVANVREKRVPTQRLVESPTTTMEDLEKDLLAEGVTLENISEDEGEDADPTLSKPQTQVYKGTLGRLNSQSYSGRAPAQGLKKHAIVKWEPVGGPSVRAAQGMEMSSHYISKHLDATSLKPKKWVESLVYVNGTHTRKALSATEFANVFLDNDATGKLRGLFDGQDKHHTMEWCHGMACSLGGASTYDNLYAASYDANTYTATIEDFLRWNRNRKKLFVWVELWYEAGGTYPLAEKRTSCRRAPEHILYRVAEDNLGKNAAEMLIDARCIGFNRGDYDKVLQMLRTNFKLGGKDSLM